ncbi:hypothetical protein CRUP_022590, partial [Coryphaenoides rupestris]
MNHSVGTYVRSVSPLTARGTGLVRRRRRRSSSESRCCLCYSVTLDSLLGPKDCQRVSLATLDARELLKHFTADGLPAGDLQPLVICRGFCLDTQRALERDLGIMRLQSRLVRFETQTTCSKEPCPLPFALSPAPGLAPSPAMASEPGSVPDGETLQLQNADVARLKHGADATLGYRRKRLVKSESCDSLCSQSSNSSGTHPSVSVWVLEYYEA